MQLAPRDHRFIDEPTIVFCPDAHRRAVQDIEPDVCNANATFHDDCPGVLLETIRQGPRDSPTTSRRLKTYVRERN